MKPLCKRKPLSVLRTVLSATLICRFHVDVYGSGLLACINWQYQSRRKTVVEYALASLHTFSSVVGLAQNGFARSALTAVNRVERASCIAAGGVMLSKAVTSSL